jgi:hypothetical protein
MSARPDLCGGYQADWYPYRDRQLTVRSSVPALSPILSFHRVAAAEQDAMGLSPNTVLGFTSVETEKLLHSVVI